MVRKKAKATEKAVSSSSEEGEEARPVKRTKPAGKNLAQIAAEEVESLAAEESRRAADKPAPPPPAKAVSPAVAETTATDRQKILAEKRLAAEAAQKLLDDEKEREQLAEENKKLKLQLQKEKQKTAEKEKTQSSSQMLRPATPKQSNSARREKKV
jgi:hypothetical protein